MMGKQGTFIDDVRVESGENLSAYDNDANASSEECITRQSTPIWSNRALYDQIGQCELARAQPRVLDCRRTYDAANATSASPVITPLSVRHDRPILSADQELGLCRLRAVIAVKDPLSLDPEVDTSQWQGFSPPTYSLVDLCLKLKHANDCARVDLDNCRSITGQNGKCSRMDKFRQNKLAARSFFSEEWRVRALVGICQELFAVIDDMKEAISAQDQMSLRWSNNCQALEDACVNLETRQNQQDLELRSARHAIEEQVTINKTLIYQREDDRKRWSKETALLRESNMTIQKEGNILKYGAGKLKELLAQRTQEQEQLQSQSLDLETKVAVLTVQATAQSETLQTARQDNTRISCRVQELEHIERDLTSRLESKTKQLDICKALNRNNGASVRKLKDEIDSLKQVLAARHAQIKSYRGIELAKTELEAEVQKLKVKASAALKSDPGRADSPQRSIPALQQISCKKSETVTRLEREYQGHEDDYSMHTLSLYEYLNALHNLEFEESEEIKYVATNVHQVITQELRADYLRFFSSTKRDLHEKASVQKVLDISSSDDLKMTGHELSVPQEKPDALHEAGLNDSQEMTSAMMNNYQTIQGLRAELQWVRNTRERARNQVHALTEENMSLHQQVKQLKQDVEEQEKQVHERDHEFLAGKELIRARSAQLVTKIVEIQTKNNKIENLERQLEILNNEVRKLDMKSGICRREVMPCPEAPSSAEADGSLGKPAETCGVKTNIQNSTRIFEENKYISIKNALEIIGAGFETYLHNAAKLIKGHSEIEVLIGERVILLHEQSTKRDIPSRSIIDWSNAGRLLGGADLEMLYALYDCISNPLLQIAVAGKLLPRPDEQLLAELRENQLTSNVSVASSEETEEAVAAPCEQKQASDANLGQFTTSESMPADSGITGKHLGNSSIQLTLAAGTKSHGINEGIHEPAQQYVIPAAVMVGTTETDSSRSSQTLKILSKESGSKKRPLPTEMTDPCLRAPKQPRNFDPRLEELGDLRRSRPKNQSPRSDCYTPTSSSHCSN